MKYEIIYDRTTVEVLEADDMESAIDMAKNILQEGDWSDGTLLRVCEIDQGNIINTEFVGVEPNHIRLISAVAKYNKVCGYNPEDHEWVFKENSNIFSSKLMVFKSYCRRCGLHRVEYAVGGPGEMVEYQMPSEDEIKYLRANGSMKGEIQHSIPWFDALESLCANVNTYTAVQDILLTSVEKGFISLDEGKEIAHDNNVGVRWNASEL